MSRIKDVSIIMTTEEAIILRKVLWDSLCWRRSFLPSRQTEIIADLHGYLAEMKLEEQDKINQELERSLSNDEPVEAGS